MVVHDAKTTYGHCKNLIKLFEALIDPIFPIVGSVVLEEPRGTYASRNQMIPASHLRIHKPKSSRSHRFISRSAEASIVLISQIIPQKQTVVNKNCLSFICATIVNRDKSRVCSTKGVEFLSYRFDGYSGYIEVSPKSLLRFKKRCREILNRNHGKSTRQRLRELRLYLRGWVNYFALEESKSLFEDSTSGFAAEREHVSGSNGVSQAPASGT
jgi:predicted nucleic acid-binding Zn ribbon protein